MCYDEITGRKLAFGALWLSISAVMATTDNLAFQLRAAPPQRQTVYYTHTGRTVVATHELYMQQGDHTFIRPLLPLYDAVRALAPPGDT